MTHELVYTSAPRGLHPGSNGYCTVAQTDGMPRALVEQLEALSGYRHLRVGPDPDANDNPVAYAHAVASAGGRTYHVLSRIADSGLDHTGRSNYLAHHVALTTSELPRQGPAAACEAWPFETAWDGTTGSLPPNRTADGSSEAGRCERWEEATGDAGWGGVLAGATSGEPAYLVFTPGQDVLGLMVEALALVPPEERWRVTFNTYFTKSSGSDCQWRGVPAGSAEAKAAISARRGVVVRLDRGATGDAPPPGPLVDAARTGVLPARRARPEREAPVARPRRVAAFDAPRDDYDELEAAANAEASAAEAVPVAPRSRPAAAPARQPSAPKAPSRGVGQLLLGLAMGLLLTGIVFALIEAGTGRSPLRHVGVKGQDEKTLDETRASLEANLATEQAKKTAAEQNFATESGKKAELNQDLGKLQGRLNQSERDYKSLEGQFSDYKVRHPDLPDAEKPKYTQKQLNEAVKDAHKQGVKDGKAQAQAHKPPEEKKDNPVAPKVEAKGENSAGKPFNLAKEEDKRPLHTSDLKRDDLTIEVLGLHDGPKAGLHGNPKAGLTVVSAGKVVTITEGDGKGDKFHAKLEISDKSVTISGQNLNKHPLLGLAIVRVKTGDGTGSEYFHLMPGDQKVAGPLPSPDGVGMNYRFDQSVVDLLKTGPMQSEFRERLKNKEFVFGAAVEVKINDKSYTLEPVKDNKGECVFEPKGDGEPNRIVLKLENGILSLGATYAKAEDRKLACQIVAAELVREFKYNDASKREVVVTQPVLRIGTQEPKK